MSFEQTLFKEEDPPRKGEVSVTEVPCMRNPSEAEIKVYNQYAKMNLPRHTSYPAVPFWKKDAKELELFQVLASAAKSKKDFSLYIHIPYCRSLCYYCGCNKEIYDDLRMRKKDPTEEFLEKLFSEMRFYQQFFQRRKLTQIHLGGGTPTFLSASQLTRLMNYVYEHFSLTESPEISIEVDPRVTKKEHLEALKKLGFNRISLGIQDFDLKVQRAVNRVQSYSLVKDMLEDCKAKGFSVNFDLIYGLPYQTKKSMEQTIAKVLKLSPDRIAFYRLAMIPQMFKWQKSFTNCDLPEEKELLEINLNAIRTFKENGYEFIGLDHFAKKSDDLSKALYNGTLRRNFQGMTTHSDLEILGIGPSSISQFDTAYLQRTKNSKSWMEKSARSFAFEQFYLFTEDDKLRKALLADLYCYGKIEKNKVSELFKIRFDEYFESELVKLERMQEEGLIELSDTEIKLTEPLGRLLVRAVAAVFDIYVEKAKKEKNSRVLFSRIG